MAYDINYWFLIKLDYKTLLNKIKTYEKKYSIKTIGETLFGRKIMAVEMVRNEHFPTAILIGSVHAREYITSDLICKMIDEDLFKEINDFNVSFIIMANPDGVEISNYGLNSCPENEREKLLKINDGNSDFSMWKANGRGVDINNNFDADFGKIVHKTTFSASGYAGEDFESENETKVVTSYTKSKNPFFTISYHSKGEEIYYNYFQSGKRLERDKFIAERFAESTGYLIKNPEESSCGGYKDYCVKQLKIPALTIEIGSDDLLHPIGKEYLDEIFEKHKTIAKDLIFAYNIFKYYETD